MAHFSSQTYLPPEEREVFRKFKEERYSMDFEIKAGEKSVKLHKIMMKLRSTGNEVRWSRCDEISVSGEFQKCLEEFLCVLYLGHPPRFYVEEVKKLWFQLELATWEHAFLWFHESNFRNDFGKINEIAGYAQWVDELCEGHRSILRSRMSEVPIKERLLPPQIDPAVAVGFFQPYRVSRARREKATDDIEDYDEAPSDPLSIEEYLRETEDLSENVNWARAMCRHMFLQKGRWVVPHRALDPKRIVDKVLVFDHTDPRGPEERALFTAHGQWTDTLRNQWDTAIHIDSDKDTAWRMMVIRGYPARVWQVHREIADRAQVLHDANSSRQLFSTSRLAGLRYSYASPAYLEALPAGCFDFLPQLCRICGELRHLGVYCELKCRKKEKKQKSKAMIRVQDWMNERIPFFQFHGIYNKDCSRYASDDPLYKIITDENPEEAPMSEVYYERIRGWLTKKACRSLSEYYAQRYRTLGSPIPDPRYLRVMSKVDYFIWDRSTNEGVVEQLHRIDEGRCGEATVVLGGEVPKTSSAATSAIKKTVVPGGKVPETSTAASTTKRSILPSREVQKTSSFASISNKIDTISDDSIQKCRKGVDILFHIDSWEWYVRYVKGCRNIKDFYPKKISKEMAIKLNLEMAEEARKIPKYVGVHYKSSSVFINRQLYYSQVWSFVLNGHVNLDEDVHLWVLPDPDEECFVGSKDTVNYEHVKREIAAYCENYYDID